MAGAHPIPVFRLLFLVIGLYAFLFDFVNPLTPTPIAVVHGKLVKQRVAVAAAAAICLPAIAPALLPRKGLLAVFTGHPADLLGLTCHRRC